MASQAAGQVAPAQQMSPQQQDYLATQAILANAVNRIQLAGQTTVFPAVNPVYLLQPLNVGFLKRYLISVSGVITNSGSQTIALTDFGLANLFGQGGIIYTDLNNYQRINTSGMHLSLIANAKRRRAMGASYQINTANGNNLSQMLNTAPATWGVYGAPQTIAAAGTGNFRAIFELPLAYTDDDLRGAISANVLNAVQQIQLTANAQPVTASPNDNTFAVYSGPAGSAGSITQMSITVLQVYLDQLPTYTDSNGRINTVVPKLSVSTVYELKSTIFSAITPNQEYQIPYANQRSFASVFAVYNNNGQVTGRTAGTDIVYWGELSANASYIWKYDPLTAAYYGRENLQEDLPLGCYYFSSRRKNVATLQYGNIQLVFNPSTATASAYVNVMWEDFALLATLQSGASLASGG